MDRAVLIPASESSLSPSMRWSGSTACHMAKSEPLIKPALLLLGIPTAAQALIKRLQVFWVVLSSSENAEFELPVLSSIKVLVSGVDLHRAKREDLLSGLFSVRQAELTAPLIFLQSGTGPLFFHFFQGRTSSDDYHRLFESLLLVS